MAEMGKLVGSRKSKRDDSDDSPTGMAGSKRHASETSVVPMVSEWATSPCLQAVEDTVMQDPYESDKVRKTGSGSQLWDTRSIAEAAARITVGSLNGLIEMCENLKGNNVAFSAFLTVFKGVAKFVINIFDLEDFEQLTHHRAIEDQRTALFEEFKELRDLTGIIDALVKGKINMDKYDRLWQADIDYLLECFVNNTPKRFSGMPIFRTKLLLGLKSEIEALDCLDVAIDAAMQRFSFETEKRMHLLLEVNEMNCQGLLDVLALDAIREMNFEDLVKDFPIENFDELVAFVLGFLVKKKSKMVDAFSNIVLRTLDSGWFGSFSDDVVKLVDKADLRRRCEGQRYISVHHILWALRHTSIAGDVQSRVQELVDELGFKPSCEPAKYPPYDIYLSSMKLAYRCGAAKVGFEHFALASVYGRNGSNLGAQGFNFSMWNDILETDDVSSFFADIQRIKYNEEMEGGKSSGSGGESSGSRHESVGIAGSESVGSAGSEISGSKGHRISESEGGSSADRSCMAKSWAPDGVSFFGVDRGGICAVIKQLKDCGWSLSNDVMMT